jgi:hypothetical protein
MESTGSLHGLHGVYMESTWSLHGVYMESTWSLHRLHGVYLYLAKFSFISPKYGSLHGVYMEFTHN